MSPDDASSDAAPDALIPASSGVAENAATAAAADVADAALVPVPVTPAGSGSGATPPEQPGTVMSLVDHLTELRNRIIGSIIAVLAGAVVGFIVGPGIITFLKSPLPLETPLVYTSIGDPFAIRIRIAIVVGIILAMPVILWHLWRFIAPGLTTSERRAILPWIPAALFFFVLGVGIAYIVLPYAATFLLSFQTEDLRPLLTAREYFDFVSTLFLAFGLLMEFPILLVGLSRVGIVTSDRLRRSRRAIILGITVFSVVATPGGDLVSPTVLGVVLYILFEGTIIVIRRSGR
jgi:sec-independent protein translocase protein TatC